MEVTMSAKWSKDEETTLKTLLAKGLSAKELSEYLPGRTTRAIQSKIMRDGLSQLNTVSWSAYDDELLFILREKGYKTSKIASILARTEKAIRSRVEKLKLPPLPSIGDEYWDEDELAEFQNLIEHNISKTKILKVFSSRSPGRVEQKYREIIANKK